jgi:hypothetical protein
MPSEKLSARFPNVLNWHCNRRIIEPVIASTVLEFVA